MIVRLTDRGVVEVTGEDRVAFLQGLLSNDVAAAAPGLAVWAALLTPQGKWLADFFILSDGARLLFDCEAAQVALLIKTLGRYRLRSKVALRDASAELAVHVAWGEAPPMEATPTEAITAADPRLPEAGWRVLSNAVIADTATEAAWHAHRIACGLPDGSRDLESDKTVLLEAGFDELHGVSWSKGCYMGQELTARTKYRGLLKRRLVPVRVAGAMPAPGTPILRDGVEIGTLRSGAGDMAMALLRLDAMQSDSLQCGTATLAPTPPFWMA